jgi:hypothetical protein
MIEASKAEEKTMRSNAAFACGLAAVLAAAPVFAETIYKYVDGEGRVTYSSVPVANVQPEKRLALDSATNVVKPPPAISGNGQSQRLREMQARRENREQARDEVVLAQQALDAAEAALIAGQEPLPGERTGACVANRGSGASCMTLNSAGMAVQGNFTSRFDEDYFQRIARLEAEVEKARVRMQQALANERGY